MTSPTVGLKLPMTSERPDTPASTTAGEWGALAEDHGYESLWVSEGWGEDALLTLMEVATRTDALRLCTAVVNPFSRTPAALAMAGAKLQRYSDGRAVLGVGPSHADTVESLHGLAFERPVRRTHEAIELVKRLTGGTGTVSYDGVIFRTDGYPAFDESFPLYNAALGAANRRATGRVADGWLPYLFPISALESGFEPIAAAARDAGRDPSDIAVAPQILASVRDDPESARDALRRYIAPYIGQFPNYRRLLGRWFPEESEAITAAWKSGDHEAARAAVTDEIVHEFGVAGTPTAARSQLRDILNDSLVDCPIVYVPRSEPAAARDRTIEALAPERL